MKIGHLEKQPATVPVANDRKSGGSEAASGGSAAAAAANGESAQVLLSDTATGLNGGGAEFDQAKVERIAQAIRDGNFTVNAEAIADKLIANAEEVLDRFSSR